MLIECDRPRQPTEDRHAVKIRPESGQARIAVRFGFRSPNADAIALDDQQFARQIAGQRFVVKRRGPRVRGRRRFHFAARFDADPPPYEIRNERRTQFGMNAADSVHLSSLNVFVDVFVRGFDVGNQSIQKLARDRDANVGVAIMRVEQIA